MFPLLHAALLFLLFFSMCLLLIFQGIQTSTLILMWNGLYLYSTLLYKVVFTHSHKTFAFTHWSAQPSGAIWALEDQGITPLWLVDNPLCLLGHSHLTIACYEIEMFVCIFMHSYKKKCVHLGICTLLLDSMKHPEMWMNPGAGTCSPVSSIVVVWSLWVW